MSGDRESVRPEDVAGLIRTRQFAVWLAFERPDAELFQAATRGDDVHILACFEEELRRAENGPLMGAKMFQGILQDIGLAPLHAAPVSTMWEELCRLARLNVDLDREIPTSKLLGIWDSR